MSEEGLGPETSQKMQLKILGVDLVIGFFLCFLFYTIVFPLAPAFKYVGMFTFCCANCIAGHGMKIAVKCITRQPGNRTIAIDNVCNLLAIPQCIV